MADELKAALAAPETAPNAAPTEDVGKRISNLTNDLNVKEQEKKDALAREAAAKAEADAAKAELAFERHVAGTPEAKEHKDEILAKAKEKGLTVEEATTLVLAGKAATKETPTPDTTDLGGSARIAATLPAAEYDSKKMTQEQRAEKLKEVLGSKEGRELFSNLNINGS